MINLSAMDMGLSIGFFTMFFLFGSLNYASVFNIVPYINETAITIMSLLLLSGAMAKSAQIPLHSWLPGSMEGLKGITNFIFFVLFAYFFFFLINNTESSIEIYKSTLPLILKFIPKEKLNIITGNMLGDGSIQFAKNNKGLYTGEAKYAMTLDAYSINYLNHLFDAVYGEYSSSGIIPYPNINNPQHADKIVTQYSFKTKSHPLFTVLHSLWYKWNEEENRYVKIVPLNIKDMFSVVSLAYWIMDDGYFDSYGRTKTILLCTESFTKFECELLQSLLSNLNIKSTLKIRNKEKDRYRIRISKTSMDLLREIVTLYMHKDFMYKLGNEIIK
jgi:hypothetical protein